MAANKHKKQNKLDSSGEELVANDLPQERQKKKRFKSIKAIFKKIKNVGRKKNREENPENNPNLRQDESIIPFSDLGSDDGLSTSPSDDESTIAPSNVGSVKTNHKKPKKKKKKKESRRKIRRIPEVDEDQVLLEDGIDELGQVLENLTQKPKQTSNENKGTEEFKQEMGEFVEGIESTMDMALKDFNEFLEATNSTKLSERIPNTNEANYKNELRKKAVRGKSVRDPKKRNKSFQLTDMTKEQKIIQLSKSIRPITAEDRRRENARRKLPNKKRVTKIGGSKGRLDI